MTGHGASVILTVMSTHNARPETASVTSAMSAAVYLDLGAGLEAIAKLHRATVPVHRVPGCAICQSLSERRAELVGRYFGPNGPPGTAR